MANPRSAHTATLLEDGRVLVAQGQNDAYPDDPAEVYDPATGQFSLTAMMTFWRIGGTATPLEDGRVLFVGGLDTTKGVYRGVVASAELYVP